MSKSFDWVVRRSPSDERWGVAVAYRWEHPGYMTALAFSPTQSGPTYLVGYAVVRAVGPWSAETQAAEMAEAALNAGPPLRALTHRDVRLTSITSLVNHARCLVSPGLASSRPM